MARELRRLLLSPERLSAATGDGGSSAVRLTGEEQHYLQRVLRLRDGDRFALVDGAGHLWQARLAKGQAELLQPLDRPLQSQAAPELQLQLAVAMPRRDGDVLLRMATELGIDRLQPLLAERSVVERWNPQRSCVIVREAVEQCERLLAPQLAEPVPLLPWLSRQSGPRFLATTREATLPQLQAVLSDLGRSLAVPTVLTVAIGPEGGWSPAEEEQAQASGWQPVQLGPTILRSSTAAVAAATLVCSWRAELG